MTRTDNEPETFRSTRVRYPLYAIAVYFIAGLFCAVEIVLLSLWMMPMVPLIPVFVMIIIGNACLLRTVHDWVISLGRQREVTFGEGTRPRGPAAF